jgi:hypothetical protein
MSSMKRFRLSTRWLVLLLGIVLSVVQTPAIAANQLSQTIVARLSDGQYQFCSEPKPNDWRTGAGVCFNFAKVGNRVDGYYGYPHSDAFVCVRGTVAGNAMTGEALEISWGGSQRTKIPPSAFHWDAEKRLTLSQGRIVRTVENAVDRTDWIIYRRASLNVDGFYQYEAPIMTPPTKLCDWEPR